MWVMLLACVIVVGIGIYEKRRHQQNIDALPVRVNINGIRGKSTVTRLTTGILIEAGYKTVGKNNRDRRKDDLLGHTGREADQKKAARAEYRRAEGGYERNGGKRGQCDCQ